MGATNGKCCNAQAEDKQAVNGDPNIAVASVAEDDALKLTDPPSTADKEKEAAPAAEEAAPAAEEAAPAAEEAAPAAEAAAPAAEDAAPAQEEEAKKKAEEEEATKKAEEEAEAQRLAEEEAKKKAEEEEAQKKAEEEEAKKKEAEEKKKKAAAAAKKKKEAEAKKKAEAEAEAKKKAEEEAKAKEHQPVPPPPRNMKNPVVKVNTSEGAFSMELYLDTMPYTVSNFCYLIYEGHFSGQHFHRIREDVLQGGCPFSKDMTDKRCGFGNGPPNSKFIKLDSKSTKKRDADGKINDEFGNEAKHWKCSNSAGTVAMANSGLANSGGSQFFVSVVDQHSLDWWHPDNRKKSEKKGQNRGHPVFANIFEGMEVVKAIADLRDPDPMKERGSKPIQICSMELTGVDLPKLARS